MSLHKILLSFLCCMILHLTTNGQGYPVSVQVNVMQPVPPYLPQIKADVAGQHFGQLNRDISNHLSVTLISTGIGRLQQHVKLAGSIERLAPSPLGVSLRPDFQPAQPVILNPGQMISLNSDMLQNAFGNFSESVLVFNNLDLDALRQNGVDYKLPEGTYRVCVTAYDYDKPGFSAPLSAPGTGCAYFTICYTASAPQLILPVSTMMQSNAGFQHFTPHSPLIQFVWTPPVSTCGMSFGALSYDLEIRQVFDGQTVTDAQNNPFVFHQQNIPSTTFLLDTMKYAHVLISGQKYTVRVRAKYTAMPGSPLEIANQGYSQIAAFNYQPSSPVMNRENLALRGDTLPAQPTVIRGRLQYRFPEDNSGMLFPVAHEKIYLEKVFVKTSVSGDSIMSYTPLTPDEQNSLPPYQDMLGGMISTTDDAGNFQLQCGMTSLDSSGIIPDSKWGLLFSVDYANNAEIIRNNTQHIILPDIEALKGQLACLYKVVTTNPHFRPYNQYLEIRPGGVRDVTNLVLDANSYALGVNVREMFNNQQGNYVAGASVKIYRLSSNKKDRQLGIPLYEGDILDSARDWKETAGKVLIAARVTPTPSQKTTDGKAYTVSFPRLFRNIGADPYNYLVCLEKGGVILGETTYSGTMTATNRNPILLFDQADALFAKRGNVQAASPVSATQTGKTLAPGPSAAGLTDEWTNWSYNDSPDTVSLTLGKELLAAPHSLVTGTLQYEYKNNKGTPARPYANQPVRLMVYYLFKSQPGASASNTKTKTANTAAGAYYYRVTNTYASQDQSYQMVEQGNGSGNEIITTANGEITDNGRVLQTVNTDANGHFVFDFENIDSTMQEMQGKLVTGIKPGPLPSGKSQTGTFIRVYRVVPAIGYYCAPDDNIPVQPWGSYDCGTLTSMVHTYNLKTTILQNDSYQALGNVPVNLCRYANDPYSSEEPGNPAGSVFLNQPVSLSGAPPAGNAAVAVNTGAGNSMVMLSNFQMPGQQMTNKNSAIIKRQGMTGADGSVTFNDVVVSIDGEKDLWVVQADGSAAQRKGSLSFATSYQLIPKDFNYSGPTAYFSGLPGENSGNISSYAIGQSNFIPYSDPSQIVFNSQLDPSETYSDTLVVKLNPPRFAGRVIDAFTNLGIPNVTVSLSLKNGGYFVVPGSYITYDFNAITDANGYFDETGYTDAASRKPAPASPDIMNIFAPGYKPYSEPVSSLTTGQQDYRDPILLYPAAANSFGYVADSDDGARPVTARVKVRINGRWVDTYTYSGDPDKPSDKSNYFITGAVYQQMISQAVETSLIQTAGSSSSAGTGAKSAGNKNLPADQNTFTYGNLVVNVNKNGTVTGMSIKQKSGTDAGYWNAVSLDGKTVTAGNGAANGKNKMTPAKATVSGVQRFDIDLPATADSIIIMPYDPAYFTRTFAVHPTGSGQNLGTFLLPKRKHKVLVQVSMPGQTPAAGAMVSIDGVPESKTVDKKGQASFEFVNNATRNFTVRVRPDDRLKTEDVPGSAVFADTSLTFTSPDDNTVKYVPVVVSRGQIIGGKVTFENTGQPVRGALVYQDQGSGSNSEIQTISDSTGMYRLVGVPLVSSALGSPDNLILKATYSAPGITYSGDQQTIPEGIVSQPVNLLIHLLNDIDISRLYGFPARLEKAVRNSDNSYTIDGELYDIPANGNFSMRTDIPGTALPFHGLKVKASVISGPGGKHPAVPAGDSIHFDMHSLSVNVFRVFNAEITETDSARLYVRKDGSDTAGLLSGLARIVDNSFNFPSSYMTISSTDFCLGNYAQPAGINKMRIPVFTSVANRLPLTRFSLTDSKAGAIAFKYLGFDGLTETKGNRESFVMGDSVNLFMNLSATIQNNIHLQFSAGKAVIRHDGISRTVNDDSIHFDLEKWAVTSGQWELSASSGGILLHSGMLHTGKVDLPFTDMSIIAGDPSAELVCKSLTSDALRAAAAKGLLTIGGGTAKLKINPGTEVVFIYDPDVGATPGKGHFKLSLESAEGKAAYFGGLDGMTNASQRFYIQFLSELSDGEELFAFDPNARSVSFYNQLQFTAQNLFSFDDRFELEGMVSTGIPGLPENISGTFTFQQQKTTPLRNHLSISPLLFSFTGDGGTQFKTSSQAGVQLFNQYGFGLGGDITVQGVNQTFRGNLISMVTSGASSLITANGDADAAAGSLPAAIKTGSGFSVNGGSITGSTAGQNIKQQAEVLMGDALNPAQPFEDQAADEVKAEINDARTALAGQLNNIRNTLGQYLPVGSSAQQIAGLAGKWRLVGEGMDAIKDFNGDPAGSLLRMNGVLNGFTGINVGELAENKLKMVANEALSGMQDKLPVDRISNAAGGAAGTFDKMHFDFDLKNGRITGSLSIPKLDFGAVVLNDIGIEMLMDKMGWYFYAGAGMDLPQSVPLHPLLFPIEVGMIIGSYPVISPDLTNRITQNSYVKKLPNSFKQGIHGFFMTGKKDILQPTALKIDFDIVNFEIGASAGLDARLYANFGDQSQQVGLAGMEFGNAYAKLDVLGACGVSGSADLNVGLKASVTNDQQGVTLKASACASVVINGEAWCKVNGAGPSASFSKSIIGMLTICGGADCNKAIDFNISLNDGSCSNNNDFDY